MKCVDKVIICTVHGQQKERGSTAVWHKIVNLRDC